MIFNLWRSLPFLIVPMLLFLASAPASPAEENTFAGPYFASIRDETVYMREGPGENYRIKWVYHRKGLPVLVIAVYETWRRVRDMDGEIGWIHATLLSRERMTVIVGKGEVPVWPRDEGDGEPVAVAEPGAIGKLVTCRSQNCHVKFNAADGWIVRSRLWGLNEGEQF